MAEKQKSSGTFQLPNGNWGYRFKLKIEGKTVDRRITQNTDGKPYKTEQAAIRARNIAIEKEKEEAIKNKREKERIEYALSALKHNPKTVSAVFSEFCENGRRDRAFATKRKQDSIWENHLKV